MPSPFTQNERDKRAVAWMRWAVDTRFKSRYVLAGKLHISQGHLSKVFAGDRGVGVKLLDALRRALDLSMTQILDDDPDPRYFRPLPGEGRRGRRPHEQPRNGQRGTPSSQIPADRRRGASR